MSSFISFPSLPPHLPSLPPSISSSICVVVRFSTHPPSFLSYPSFPLSLTKPPFPLPLTHVYTLHPIPSPPVHDTKLSLSVSFFILSIIFIFHPATFYSNPHRRTLPLLSFLSVLSLCLLVQAEEREGPFERDESKIVVVFRRGRLQEEDNGGQKKMR